MSNLTIELECPICLVNTTNIDEIVINPLCPHAVCKDCFKGMMEGSHLLVFRDQGLSEEDRRKKRAFLNFAIKCPICREPFIDPKELTKTYTLTRNRETPPPAPELRRARRAQRPQTPPLNIDDLRHLIPPPMVGNEGHPLPNPIVEMPQPQPVLNINFIGGNEIEVIRPHPPQPPILGNEENIPPLNPHRDFGFGNQQRPRCLTRICNTPRGTQRKCPNHHGVPCCRECNTCFICKGILSRVNYLNNSINIPNPDPSIQHIIHL